jgi:hypothetical protein
MRLGALSGFIAGLWLMILLSASGAEQPGAIQTPSIANPSLSERDYDVIEEHESNGPEGASGVSMQRLSATGIACVLGLLLTSYGLTALARKSKPTSEQTS